MKKVIVIVMSIVMIMSIVSGCSSTKGGVLEQQASESSLSESTDKPIESSKEPAQQQKKTIVRYVTPGNPAKDEIKVGDAISAKLEKDGYNIAYKSLYIPWDVWDQKTTVMISTGEEFELITIMTTAKSLPIMVGENSLQPIDEYVADFGSSIQKVIPDYAMNAAKVQGKLYSIPSVDCDQLYKDGWITIRKDLFDKYNLPVPKSPDELFESTIKIMEAENIKPMMAMDGFFHGNQHYRPFNRLWDSWPSNLFENHIIFVDKDGNVKSFVETEEFKKDSELYRKMYVMGITPKDVLNFPTDKEFAAIENGQWVFQNGFKLGWWPAQKLKVPDMKEEAILFRPELPLNRFMFFGCSTGVPVTSKNPESGIQFLNWLYSSQENHDLLHLGIEGVHWKATGEKSYEVINPNDVGYSFANWKISEFPLLRHPEILQQDIDVQFTSHPDAINHISAGFVFDSRSVSSELAACINEYKTSFFPIGTGVQEYDKFYPEALKKMKAAGIDKVVAEFDKQFKEYLKIQ